MTLYDDIVCSTTVTQLLSSDPYFEICDLSAANHVNNADLKQASSLHGIDLTTFEEDRCQSTLPTLCSSSEMPDASLTLVLEKHAHVSSCRVPAN